MRPERRSGGLRTARGAGRQRPAQLNPPPCWSKLKAINPRGVWGTASPRAARLSRASENSNTLLHHFPRKPRHQISCARSEVLLQEREDRSGVTIQSISIPVEGTL